MKKELKDFLRVADIELGKVIESVMVDLEEEDPEKYNERFEDYGYYNNGVGMACCGGEWVYDDEKAHEDAVEKIADSIQDGDIEYLDMLLMKKAFRHALADLIRSK